MRLRSLLFLFLLSFQATMPFSAYAHKVNLFCYRAEGKLKGEGYYSRGRPAQNSQIEVYTLETNRLLDTTTTNEKGKFEIPLKTSEGLHIIMKAGQGHKAEFTMEKTLDEPAMITNQPLRESKGEEASLRHAEQASEIKITSILMGLISIIGIFAGIYWIKKKNAS